MKLNKTEKKENPQTQEAQANTKHKGKIDKHHWQGALAILIVIVLITAFVDIPTAWLMGTVAPVNLDGASKTEVTYLTEGTKRVGVKEIDMTKSGGPDYIDIYGGQFNTEANTSKTQFYTRVLTAKLNGSSVLDDWSMLAYNILSDNYYYAAVNISSKQSEFDKWLSGKGSHQDGWADLVRDFRRTASYTNGEVSHDNTHVTGLSFANSLASVRAEIGAQLAARIGLNLRPGKVLAHTDGGNALAILDNDSPTDVMYNIVTAVNNHSGRYRYNALGLAFYDFKLQVIDDENLEYISPVNEYGSVKDAAAAGIPDVSYREISKKDPKIEYFENTAATTASTEVQYTQGDTVTVTNGFSQTQQYSVAETVGGSMSLGKANDNFVHGSFGFSITASQMFGDTTSESKSMSQNNVVAVGTSVNVPGHTAYAVELSEGQIEESMTYHAPVAISYKVAVFSLSGDYYDLAGVTSFSTAGYWQQHFAATFGDRKGDARAELIDRIQTNYFPGYDKDNGNTYGWADCHDDGNSAKTVNQLNWANILKHEVVSENVSLPSKHTGQDAANAIIPKVPMSAFGATMSQVLDSQKAVIQPLTAIYPLRAVRYKDMSVVRNYAIKPGESLTIRDSELDMRGYNEYEVEYNGFNSHYGSWILTDASGNKISDTPVASFSYDPKTWDISVKGLASGEMYLKYVIDEDKYVSVRQSEMSPVRPTTNAQLQTTAMIRITVGEEHLADSDFLIAEGSVTGMVGDVFDLNADDSPVLVYAEDETGKEIPVDHSLVKWEAKKSADDKSISEGHILTLLEVGSHSIRAIYKGKHTEWVDVTVLAADDLSAGAGGDDSSTGGDDPSTGGDDPSVGGDDPSVGGNDPSSGGDDPSAGGDDPSAGGDDPSAGGDDPSAGGGDGGSDGDNDNNSDASAGNDGGGGGDGD